MVDHNWPVLMSLSSLSAFRVPGSSRKPSLNIENALHMIEYNVLFIIKAGSSSLREISKNKTKKNP